MYRELFDRWVELGRGRVNRLTGTFALTALGKLVHHHLPGDREDFLGAMNLRRELGRRYRGY